MHRNDKSAEIRGCFCLGLSLILTLIYLGFEDVAQLSTVNFGLTPQFLSAALPFMNRATLDLQLRIYPEDHTHSILIIGCLPFIWFLVDAD